MEGEAIPTGAAADTASSTSHDFDDVSAAGSPEDLTSQVESQVSPSDDDDGAVPPSVPGDDLKAKIIKQAESQVSPSDDDDGAAQASVMGDDLKAKIIKQVEYYFSDGNLRTDKYMLSLIKKNKEGFVLIGVIASFKKMKKLSRDHYAIAAALRESSLLVVSADGTKVKRLNPFSFCEVKHPKLCTVLVENLPEDHSMGNIQKIFGEVGNIKSISICDPHAVEEYGKVKKLISDKLHALVEYDTVEDAEKAVATLNNKEDWRNGMRVKLLNRLGQYGQRKKSWKESGFDANTNSRAANPTGEEVNSNLSDHHDETPDEEEGDDKEKNEQRGRRRGQRGRRSHGISGLGHGTTLLSSHAVELSKPPPGPRMPDGTRGFTIGRGRPPAPTQN